MNTAQPGILLSIPPVARYLTFSLKPGVNPRGPLRELRDVADGERVAAGIGESLALALGRNIEGLRAYWCPGTRRGRLELGALGL